MMLNSRKKSCTIFSSKFAFKIRFKATGVSCPFRVPEKTIPVPPVASKTIAGKDFAPVIAVGRGMWFDLGRLLPQKHGQNLWLSCPLFWLLLGPGIIKKTPYLSGPGPASYSCRWSALGRLLHGCCLQTVLIWRAFSRRNSSASEPLAARMDSRFLCHMCVGYSS